MATVGTRGGGGAAVDAEVLEDLPEVILHGEEAAAEDDTDFIIGFSIRHPVQHLGLAVGQLQMPHQKSDRSLQGLGMRMRRGSGQTLP